MATKIWVGGASGAAGDLNTADNWAPISIRSAAYQWTASGSGTNEYYLQLAGTGGGDPQLTEPDKVYAGGVALQEGTAGMLAAGEWAWDDNDALGFNTVYVRLSDGADPDDRASGFVTYVQTLRAGDDVLIQGNQSITDGLDQSEIELNSFVVAEGYSGMIGSVTRWLQVDVADGNRFEFAGTGRAYIDVGSSAITIVVNNTATASQGAGLYLNGSAIVLIDLRKGNVELHPGATVTTISQRYTDNQGSDTSLTVPAGVTLTTLSKTGGACRLSAAATTVSNAGGTLRIEGAGAITTLNVTGGNVYPSSTGTITTLNADGGTTDFTRSIASRTVTTINRTGSAVVVLDDSSVTITNPINSDGPFRVTGV